MDDPGIALVFAAAMVTAIATGFGALPLLSARFSTDRGLAIGNALAAGLMLAACFVLILEGFAFSPLRSLAGVVLGVGGIVLANGFIRRHDGLSIADIHGADARKIVLIVGIMAAHSAAEGVGVGVAFAGDEGLGTFITVTIALHNVPQGLAVCLIMVPRGASVPKAALWAIGTSLPQPLLAVPAFLFVLTFEPWLPVGLGFAAGAMMWVIIAELLPDAQEGTSRQSVGVVATLAFAAMLGLTLLI